jgi:hypothetical protein
VKSFRQSLEVHFNRSTSVGWNNSVIDLDEEEEHNVGELTLYLPVNRET